MKILVIQLARLGDIFMTWPMLRALKRLHPEAELHLLTRSRFANATQGLQGVDRHLHLPTSFILEPLIQPSLDLDQSLERVGTFVGGLRSEHYDWVINLTFSPASSYLTHAITTPQTRVTGYTRHSDGYLNLPDEVSAYFYAQVGVNSSNRVHLTDIFISMLGYDYTEEDWESPKVDARDFGLPEKYMLVHIGASEAKKSLPPFKWARVLKNFFDKTLEVPVVMIGASNEIPLGRAIEAGVSRGRVINLIGQTHLQEIFSLLQGAQLLVGCDSAPMHMASLTNTPCLNISFDTVNFWETGPKSTRSYIYKASFPEDVVSEELGSCMHRILCGEDPSELIQRSAGLASYLKAVDDPDELFTWNLVQALYLSGDFPVTDDMQFCRAILKINEVNDLAREYILGIPDKGLEIMGPLLNRVDEVMVAVSRVMPKAAPIIKWYQTEKIRIAPDTPEVVAARTLEVHEKLQRILSVYMLEDSIKAHDVSKE